MLKKKWTVFFFGSPSASLYEVKSSGVDVHRARLLHLAATIDELAKASTELDYPDNKTKPQTRRAPSNAAATMSGWAGKQVPSFDVTMVSSNGTIGAKMPLSAMLGKPLVIHLYNGG